MDLLLFVGGLILIIKGRVRITSKSEISPAVGRILGAICMLPSTIFFVIGFLKGASIISVPSWETSFWDYFSFGLYIVVTLSFIAAILFFRRPIEAALETPIKTDQLSSQSRSVVGKLKEQIPLKKKFFGVYFIVAIVLMALVGSYVFYFRGRTPDSNLSERTILSEKPYENSELRFRIYPPNNWVTETGDPDLLVKFTNPVKDIEKGTSGNVNINIVVEAVPRDSVLEKFISDSSQSKKDKIVLRGGYDAYLLEQIVPLPQQGGVLVATTQLVTLKEYDMSDIAFIVSGASLESAWKKYENAIRASLMSFEFFDPLVSTGGEEKLFPVSSGKALKIAKEYAGLGPLYFPEARNAYDSAGAPWYLIDFFRFDKNQGELFWGGRIIIGPYDGKVVVDEKKYEELGKIPSYVDPSTRQAVATVSVDQAIDVARNYAGSPSDWFVSNWVTNNSFGKSFNVVEFYRQEEKTGKLFYEKTFVVDPYDGAVVTDKRVLGELGFGDNYLPLSVDPVTKEYSVPNPIVSAIKSLFQEKLTWFIVLGIFLAVAAIIYWRKKVKNIFRKIQPIFLDVIFGIGILIELGFAFYFYRSYQANPISTNDLITAIGLVTSAVGTVSTWVFTKIVMRQSPDEDTGELIITPPQDLPNFSSVGGMEGVKEELRNTVGLIMSRGKLAQQYGVNFNGVLLFGPPGVGKSYITEAAAGEFGLNLLRLKVSDLVGIYKGTSTHKIQQAFKTALKQAPCLLFFDEFESVAGERGVVSLDVDETRAVNQLLRSLEEIRSHPGKVIVFAATNKKEDLDEAIIRPGRFDKQIYIPMPDDAARKSIIESRLRGKPFGPNIDLGELVGKTSGMSAADIAAIVDKAVLDILSASLGDTPRAKTLDQKQLVWAIDNFREKHKPSVKKLNWSDLILQEEVMAELKRFVKIIENPDITRKLGIEPPKGVLIYGPPGTGKTTIAKVIANEANASFFSIGGADIHTKWFGESERKIKNIFEEARKYKPSIIFIDEIESIVSKRGGHEGWEYMDKLVSQILSEIDGMKDAAYVFIIGATNDPDGIDPALLRGGRLSTQIEIPLPGKPEREKLFALFLKKTQKAADVKLNELAESTENYSGADIQDICQRAILDVFDRSGGETTEITHADLKASLQKYKKSSKVYHVPEYFKKKIEEGLSTQNIAERFNQTVVVVINKSGTWKEREPFTIGSGVLISDTGIIITNFHVIENAVALEIKLITGASFPVKRIMGLNKDEDIAILSIDTSGLPYAIIGDSNRVQVGERVVAIGNPRGLAHTVSDGIVSARRMIEGKELIQITAPISPGSSGGPVFNNKGEVIGIAKMIILESQNLNFVIPSSSITTLLVNPTEIPMSALQREEDTTETPKEGASPA